MRMFRTVHEWWSLELCIEGCGVESPHFANVAPTRSDGSRLHYHRTRADVKWLVKEQTINLHSTLWDYPKLDPENMTSSSSVQSMTSKLFESLLVTTKPCKGLTTCDGPFPAPYLHEMWRKHSIPAFIVSPCVLIILISMKRHPSCVKV